MKVWVATTSEDWRDSQNVFGVYLGRLADVKDKIARDIVAEADIDLANARLLVRTDFTFERIELENLRRKNKE